jgi:hypothetical protein
MPERPTPRAGHRARASPEAAGGGADQATARDKACRSRGARQRGATVAGERELGVGGSGGKRQP